MLANYPPDNHFVLLANQFLHFDTALNPINLPRGDIAEFYDKRFLYFGPLTSLILSPFVLIFGTNFPQQIIGPIASIIIFICTLVLAKRFTFHLSDQLWFSIFTVFSTVIFAASLIPISAYQAQIIGSTFIFLALAEYFSGKRPFLIGFFLACAGLSRATLYLTLVFFALELVFKNLTFKKFGLMLLPIIISVILLGGYNYRRFRNPFESGYRYNMTHASYPLANNIRYGLWNTKYIPTNLYSLLVKSPDPIVEGNGGFILKSPYLKIDPWGLAIWFTSPLLLALLFKFKKDRLSINTIITSIILAIPTLTFFSIGYVQVGYRYALDFLPFILVLLMNSTTPRLGFPHKLLIVLGVAFNLLYIASPWGIYPLLGIR